MKAIAAAQHKKIPAATAEAGVVAGIAAATVGCCSCCFRPSRNTSSSATAATVRSILRTGGNRDTASSIEHLIPDTWYLISIGNTEQTRSTADTGSILCVNPKILMLDIRAAHAALYSSTKPRHTASTRSRSKQSLTLDYLQ